MTEDNTLHNNNINRTPNLKLTFFVPFIPLLAHLLRPLVGVGVLRVERRVPLLGHALSAQSVPGEARRVLQRQLTGVRDVVVRRRTRRRRQLSSGALIADRRETRARLPVGRLVVVAVALRQLCSESDRGFRGREIDNLKTGAYCAWGRTLWP